MFVREPCDASSASNDAENYLPLRVTSFLFAFAAHTMKIGLL